MPPGVRHYQNVANCSVRKQLLPANASVCSTAANLPAQSQKTEGSVARSLKLYMGMRHERPESTGQKSFVKCSLFLIVCIQDDVYTLTPRTPGQSPDKQAEEVRL